jgi:hypothetical protein
MVPTTTLWTICHVLNWPFVFVPRCGFLLQSSQCDVIPLPISLKMFHQHGLDGLFSQFNPHIHHYSRFPPSHIIELMSTRFFVSSTRLNIAYFVGVVTKFAIVLCEVHLEVVIFILGYLKGSLDFAIHYQWEGDIVWISFTNNDYLGNLDFCKSFFGYLFNIGSEPTSWKKNSKMKWCNLILKWNIMPL